MPAFRLCLSDDICFLPQAKYKFQLTKLDYTTNTNWYHMMPGTYTELEVGFGFPGLKLLSHAPS